MKIYQTIVGFIAVIIIIRKHLQFENKHYLEIIYDTIMRYNQ